MKRDEALEMPIDGGDADVMVIDSDDDDDFTESRVEAVAERVDNVSATVRILVQSHKGPSGKSPGAKAAQQTSHRKAAEAGNGKGKGHLVTHVRRASIGSQQWGCGRRNSSWLCKSSGKPAGSQSVGQLQTSANKAVRRQPSFETGPWRQPSCQSSGHSPKASVVGHPKSWHRASTLPQKSWSWDAGKPQISVPLKRKASSFDIQQKGGIPDPKLRNPKGLKDSEGRLYDLKRVVVNFANVGFIWQEVPQPGMEGPL